MKIKLMKSLINPKSILSFLIIVGFLSYQYYQDFVKDPLKKEKVTLISCVDGDTAKFDIRGKKTTVRFLGIDTPETVKPGTSVQPYGKESSEKTCHLLSNANSISLEYEKEKKDKYERTLAWVWIDGSLIQLELIDEGLAQVKYLYDNYKYTSILQEAEREAKARKIGMWYE